MASLRRAVAAFVGPVHSSMLVSPTLEICEPHSRFVFPRLSPRLAPSFFRLESTHVAAVQQQQGAAGRPPDETAEPPPPYNPPEGYNPPETAIPDPTTLADQWQYATTMFSRFISQAWGMAILTGLSAFGVGWVIKGSNPLHTTVLNRESDSDGGGDVEGSAKD